MRTEFRKDKTNFYTKGLTAVTVFLGALTFLRVSGFLAASSEAQAMAARMDPNAQGLETAGDVSKLLASAKASAEELKKKNLFVKIPPKQNPVNQVLGILGDEALVNDKWCKVGDTVGDAKIVAIEPTKVRVVWNGEEKEFSPIEASGGPSGGPEPPRPGGRPPSGGKGPVAAANSGGGPTLPRRMSGLSDAERERMRAQWQNMSPEERQRARQEMRQRLGARPR